MTGWWFRAPQRLSSLWEAGPVMVQPFGSFTIFPTATITRSDRLSRQVDMREDPEAPNHDQGSSRGMVAP
jgi:hypothetical protein